MQKAEPLGKDMKQTRSLSDIVSHEEISMKNEIQDQLSSRFHNVPTYLNRIDYNNPFSASFDELGYIFYSGEGNFSFDKESKSLAERSALLNPTPRQYSLLVRSMGGEEMVFRSDLENITDFLNQYSDLVQRDVQEKKLFYRETIEFPSARDRTETFLTTFYGNTVKFSAVDLTMSKLHELRGTDHSIPFKNPVYFLTAADILELGCLVKEHLRKFLTANIAQDYPYPHHTDSNANDKPFDPNEYTSPTNFLDFFLDQEHKVGYKHTHRHRHLSDVRFKLLNDRMNEKTASIDQENLSREEVLSRRAEALFPYKKLKENAPIDQEEPWITFKKLRNDPQALEKSFGDVYAVPKVDLFEVASMGFMQHLKSDLNIAGAYLN